MMIPSSAILGLVQDLAAFQRSQILEEEEEVVATLCHSPHLQGQSMATKSPLRKLYKVAELSRRFMRMAN